MRVRAVRGEELAAETAQEPIRPEVVVEWAKREEVRGDERDACLHELPEDCEAHEAWRR